MVIVSKQVFADVVYVFCPIGWIDATGVTDGVGVPVGVVVIVVVMEHIVRIYLNPVLIFFQLNLDYSN